jgi:apolipoprotein N-acyltransferase
VVLRAVENRRDVVRATSTGISCYIDSRGTLRASAPIGTPYYFVANVHLHEGETPYTRFGDWFVLLCAIAMILVIRGRRPAEARP